MRHNKPPSPPLSPPSNPLPQPKRGRPATGKRSNPDWIGRTYYIQRKTDLDIEGELFQLKRQGIDLDKSELVDLLLSAWVYAQQSNQPYLHLSDLFSHKASP
jgi:hypothetical protein